MFLFFTFKGYHIHFGPCAKTERKHHCPDAVAYIQDLPLVIAIHPRPLIINMLHWRPSKDAELPRMGMSRKCQLNVSLRHNLALPLSRVMVEQYLEATVAKTCRRFRQISQLREWRSTAILHTNNRYRVCPTTQHPVFI